MSESISAIICDMNIIPDAPYFEDNRGRLKFIYKEYYLSVYYDKEMIGYFDCPQVDVELSRKSFTKLINSFTKDFYSMLSKYMSF